MKTQISVILAFLACVGGALAGSSLGSVSVGPQSPDPVIAGSNATYTVTVTRTGTGNLDIYLSVTNLPAGVTGAFVPSVVHFASSTSTNTSTLTLSTTAAVPPSNYVFLVTARDGGSPNIQTSQGTLAVAVNPNSLPGPSLSLQISPVGSIQITCLGAPNYPCQIQATTDLVNTSWTTIGSGTTDATGRWVFADSQAGSYDHRFYRALGPK